MTSWHAFGASPFQDVFKLNNKHMEGKTRKESLVYFISSMEICWYGANKDDDGLFPWCGLFLLLLFIGFSARFPASFDRQHVPGKSVIPRNVNFSHNIWIHADQKLINTTFMTCVSVGRNEFEAFLFLQSPRSRFWGPQVDPGLRLVSEWMFSPITAWGSSGFSSFLRPWRHAS